MLEACLLEARCVPGCLPCAVGWRLTLAKSEAAKVWQCPGMPTRAGEGFMP